MALCRNCGTELDPDGTCAICMLAGAFVGELTSAERTAEIAADLSNEVELSEALEYDSFGAYRILQVLGEGGMGAVYLAEQMRPLRRHVALKVVKLGLSSSHVLSRFNYERQALALMDHPNIAHVYEAGASEKGRPYFAMEYVDGVAITEYCDQHRLNTRERLELFIPVCQALLHAHQRGVIHRDIKPSNVMVTEVDGRATPKVIDFGIARAVEQNASEEFSMTQLGQFIGTLEYMSPEQTDLVTGHIDTSSDVYSLGVLLYELLIGAVPFNTERLRKASLAELLRIIREEEAIPMPARLAQMGDGANGIAERRRTDTTTLRRLIRGDLNWIVRRAMEKDRRRRYASASELAADIRRHLDDHPVLANPPGKLYLIWKFVSRHRTGVIAAAAVVSALVIGIVTTTWQATIARRERAQAVTARTLAEARLNDVHALADSMLFEINDGVKNLTGGTKAREALVRLGQQYLNKEVASPIDPQRRTEIAEAFLQVGDLQGAPGESNLRDVAGARKSYAKSVAILEGEVSAHPYDARSRHLLTTAYVRQAQLDESVLAGKAFGSSIYTFTTSWAQLDDSDSPSKPVLERASNSADIYMALWPSDQQGQRDRCEVLQAERQFASAVALRARILKRNPLDAVLRWELAHAEIGLGASLVFKNRREALEWLKKGAAACAVLSRGDPSNVRYQRDRAVALGSMTRVLLNLSELQEAVASARESVAILEHLTAADSRNASCRLDLSAARVALSNAYFDNGQAGKALENVAVAAALQEQQAKLDPENPDFPQQAAYNYRNAGRLKGYLKDFSGALEEYRRAETLDRKLVARYPASFELSESLRQDLDSAAGAHLGLGQTAAALDTYREALSISRSTVFIQHSPESYVSVALAHQSMAQGLRALARLDDAIVEQRVAVAIWEGRVSRNRTSEGLQRARSRSLEDLAKLYDARGDYRTAVTVAENARSFLDADFKAHPDDESALTELRNALVCARTEYLRVGNYAAAIDAAERVLEMTRHTGVVSRSRANQDLGEALIAAGRREAGLAAYRRAALILDETTTATGASHAFPIEKEPSPFYRNVLALNFVSIADALTSAGHEKESAVLMRRLIPILESMTRQYPANNSYRDTLRAACRARDASQPPRKTLLHAETRGLR